MPEKSNKTAYDVQYHKKTYQPIMISVRKDSEIWDALQEAKAHTGIPYSTYAHTALVEKLCKDGYLQTE